MVNTDTKSGKAAFAAALAAVGDWRGRAHRVDVRPGRSQARLPRFHRDESCDGRRLHPRRHFARAVPPDLDGRRSESSRVDRDGAFVRRRGRSDRTRQTYRHPLRLGPWCRSMVLRLETGERPGTTESPRAEYGAEFPAVRQRAPAGGCETTIRCATAWNLPPWWSERCRSWPCWVMFTASSRSTDWVPSLRWRCIPRSPFPS